MPQGKVLYVHAPREMNRDGYCVRVDIFIFLPACVLPYLFFLDGRTFSFISCLVPFLRCCPDTISFLM